MSCIVLVKYNSFCLSSLSQQIIYRTSDNWAPKFCTHKCCHSLVRLSDCVGRISNFNGGVNVRSRIRRLTLENKRIPTSYREVVSLCATVFTLVGTVTSISSLFQALSKSLIRSGTAGALLDVVLGVFRLLDRPRASARVCTTARRIRIVHNHALSWWSDAGVQSRLVNVP